MSFTKELKDMWLAELRDPNNTQIKRTFALARDHYEWGLQNDISKPRPKTERLCTSDSVEMKTASCLCAAGCLIKAHAKLSEAWTYIGIDAVHVLPMHQIHDIYIMNDSEGKSFAEIADWVEANCKLSIITPNP